jgi:hypothetical protein
MTSTIPSTISLDSLPDDWEVQTTTEQMQSNLFSADVVINAYFQGKKAQDALNDRILTENLDKAMTLSSGFSEKLKEKNIKCKLTLLKPKQITEFESLFVIDEEDYISAEFDEAYRLTISEKEIVNNETFHFSYIFIPDSEDLNREKLTSNGYVFEYKR